MRSINLIKNFDLMRSNQIRSKDQTGQIRDQIGHKFDQFRSNLSRNLIGFWLHFDRFSIELGSNLDRTWSYLNQNLDRHSINSGNWNFDRNLSNVTRFEAILASGIDQKSIRGPFVGNLRARKECSGTTWSVPGALQECPESVPEASVEHQVKQFGGIGIGTNPGTKIWIALWASWNTNDTNFG